MNTENKSSLQLDRTLQNPSFESWRLIRSPGFVSRRSEAPLAGCVKPADSASIDYLHTRASVLRNHLHHSQGRVFAFAAAPHDRDDGPHSFQLLEVMAGGAEEPVELVPVTYLPASAGPNSDPTQACAPAPSPLDPSIAVIDTSAQPPNSSASSTRPWGGNLLLVSLGRGDLRLIEGSSKQNQPASPIFISLYPHLALSSLQNLPFVVEGAYVTAEGHLRCILWTLLRRDQGVSEPCCDVFLVTFGNGGDFASPEHVQLLRRTALPPHLVMANPFLDQVLLGVDPQNSTGSEEYSTPAANSITAVKAAAHPGLGRQAGPATTTADNDEDDEHDDVEPQLLAMAAARLAGSSTAGGAASAGGLSLPPANMFGSRPTCDDDEECDVDARTLAEAAARLAKYTAEGEADEAPPPPCQQWADVYKETGPDGVGGMGSEPLLDFLVVPAAASGCQAGISTQAHGRATALPTWHISCGASRVISSEAGAQGLVGLSDDVDCAVVRLGWSAEATAAGMASSQGAGGVGRGSCGSLPFAVHQQYIPALAYVVAGKLQRKHLLLGEPGGKIAAVLVEGTRFCYIYAATSGVGEKNGMQEVVDMELHEGERVMGARLLQTEAMTEGSAPQGGPWTLVGSKHVAKANMVLLVLTQERLLALSLDGRPER